MIHSKILYSTPLPITLSHPLFSEEWKSHLRNKLYSLLKGEEREKVFFLFSIDPGLGKTKGVISFLADYKIGGFAAGGSVIIFLSRLREIDSIVAAAGLGVSDFAVVSSDKDMNSKGLGASCANKARVLFTTQQMLYARMGDKSFADMAEFWFEGALRPLRIWDETITPAKEIAIRIDALNSLAITLRKELPHQVAMLDCLIRDLGLMAIGDDGTLPVSIKHDTQAIILSDEFGALEPHQKDAVRALQALAGYPFGLLKDNWHGKVLVGAGRRLPEDLAPMIVLDASGSVRATYDLWETEGAQLVRLPAVRAAYENLNVHVWEYGSSKSTLEKEDKRAAVISACSDLLNKDDEEWLIAHHKEDDSSIAAQIITRVKRPERIKTIHWGDHHGINDHRLIKKDACCRADDISTLRLSGIAHGSRRRALVLCRSSWMCGAQARRTEA